MICWVAGGWLVSAFLAALWHHGAVRKAKEVEYRNRREV